MSEIERKFLEAERFISEHCRTQDFCDSCDVKRVCLNPHEAMMCDGYCWDSTPDLWPVDYMEAGEDE